MRPERCSDDESDSYPQIGYQHFIDSPRACLALESGISLAVPCRSLEGCPIVARVASPDRSEFLVVQVAWIFSLCACMPMVRISANVTDVFGNVTDLGAVLGCVDLIVRMRSVRGVKYLLESCWWDGNTELC